MADLPELILKDEHISRVKHNRQQLAPQPVLHVDLARLDVRDEAHNVSHTLRRMSFSVALLHVLRDRRAEAHLLLTEFLVDLMAEHLAEQQHLLALILVLRDGTDDGVRLVHDERLQAILLTQVRAQELLHGLAVLLVHVDALVVVANLLSVDVLNEVSHVVQRDAEVSFATAGRVRAALEVEAQRASRRPQLHRLPLEVKTVGSERAAQAQGVRAGRHIIESIVAKALVNEVAGVRLDPSQLLPNMIVKLLVSRVAVLSVVVQARHGDGISMRQLIKLQLTANSLHELELTV